MQVWDKLRKIADDAERASQLVLSEEAGLRLKEYREAQIADPVDLIVRVPRPTAWQLQALRVIAAGGARPYEMGDTPWRDFIRATKPHQEGCAEIDEESAAIRRYAVDGETVRLNSLGLALLNEFSEGAA